MVWPAVPAAATTVTKEDVDGRPFGRCSQWVQQRPSSKFKKSMAGPLEGATEGSNIDHH
jgi:hypothetical protein